MSIDFIKELKRRVDEIADCLDNQIRLENFQRDVDEIESEFPNRPDVELHSCFCRGRIQKGPHRV